MGFSYDTYCGHIVQGDLLGAMRYVEQFPEQAELHARYIDIFERERYVNYDTDAELNGVLTIYQKYYRDAFYLCMAREEAADRLRAGLAQFLGADRERISLDEMERNQLVSLFQSRGYHFLGGRTSGWYGPYIWRTTEPKTYRVELPEGVQAYTVRLLDGFLSRGWPDYLSFGRVGTGGWTDRDGTINCILSAYDVDSEAFRVSLLKHEAQHAMDLKARPDMPSADLEYRAKLVELIYSRQRNLLEQFARECGAPHRDNGHAAAAARIIDGFARKLGLTPEEIPELPNERVRATARELFLESGRPDVVQ